MDASDQAAIIKMMDEPDGVVNRRVRKKTAAASQPIAATAKLSTSSTATIVHRKDATVRFHNSKKSAEAKSIEESGAERG